MVRVMVRICHSLLSASAPEAMPRAFNNNNNNINNDNIQDNVYGAVIMTEPLRKFTRFI